MAAETLFSSDKPISSIQDDKFQRYGFAKRVADTIEKRNSKDCIVIGIYGAWGEGKTSVINFIETELKSKDHIITVKFNPWRYGGEEELLGQFFQELSNVLNINLKTKKEQFGALMSKYAKMLKFDIPVIGGNFGEGLVNAGELLSNISIDTIKERMEDILEENDKKIVIFIDDIDRLDKTEIHAIFRLVKLTADFSNTTYILSFDEEMVSAAIGDRFGEGNAKSGQIFLEKIIQVPLKIPVAHPQALQSFCFELIEKAISTSDIDLTELETRRFTSEFTTNVLSRLNNPRLAIRYANNLSFSIPLLAGEIDIVDMMLMEAIKIFYPKHYNFIKDNPDYFIYSYTDSNSFSINRDKNKINSLKEHLEDLSENLTKTQKQSILDLLEELFPRLKEVFGNYYHNEQITEKWFKNKRIVSPKYFSKYFGYTIIKGEVSDKNFDSFVSKVELQNINEIIDSIKILIEQSSPSNFIEKLSVLGNELPWSSIVKIIESIARISNIFPKTTDSIFTWGSPNGQVALFIYNILKKHNNIEENLTLAKQLMLEAQPFDFAYDINDLLRYGETEEDKIFNTQQYEELAKLLINRSLKEADNESIFEKFPNSSQYLLGCWADENREGLNNYISNVLEKDPHKVIDLLRVFTPTGYSTRITGPYKTDFKKDNYLNFISIFEKRYIDQIISRIYTQDQLEEKLVEWTYRNEENQTNINIIRQFKYWMHKEDNESII